MHDIAEEYVKNDSMCNMLIFIAKLQNFLIALRTQNSKRLLGLIPIL